MKAKKEQLKNLDRLQNRSDFLRIQKAGTKWISHGLILQAAQGEDNKIRYGLTVSKKLSKSAVRRNRIKRRLRAAVCDVLPLYARPGYDFVLIGRQETATRPYAQLCQDLRWCLDKMKLVREE